MDNMVERVAEALCNNRPGIDWMEMEQGQRDLWRDDARAAIAAMREPNWPMIYAGAERTEADPGDIWRAMIDAALAKAPSPTS